MNIQKGIVTLTLLILLNSILLILLLFDSDIISLHSAIVSQRKIYLEQSLVLQKQSISEKERICNEQLLNNDLKSLKVKFESSRKTDRTSQFIWCERKNLFKQQPRKSFYVMGLNEYLNMDLLELFQSKLISPPNILPKDSANSIYWFAEDTAEWELDGNINAIILAKGNLKLKGKGKISGSVITGGNLSIEPEVKLIYKPSTVVEIIRAYSYWQFVEKSWHDFSPLQ